MPTLPPSFMSLVEAKGHLNPMISLYLALKERGEPDSNQVGSGMAVEELMILEDQMTRALQDGPEEINLVNNARVRLTHAAAIPSTSVLEGF